MTIIGPRQCGKSTLVRGLRHDWKDYDLESPDDYQLISSDPVAFFTLNTDHVIIDEAQQYPDLFKVLRGVVDADRKQKGRFILTGSSSPEIVKGLPKVWLDEPVPLKISLTSCTLISAFMALSLDLSFGSRYIDNCRVPKPGKAPFFNPRAEFTQNSLRH